MTIIVSVLVVSSQLCLDIITLAFNGLLVETPVIYGLVAAILMIHADRLGGSGRRENYTIYSAVLTIFLY